MSDPIHVLSLGAGVQSSTLALMAAEGLVTPMPEFAVFADTGDEPQAVYEWLVLLSLELPFPIRRARKGVAGDKLSNHIVEGDHSQIPAFYETLTGALALGKRQCTNHWKIRPIERAIRQHTDSKGKRLAPGSIIQWIGISIDEIHRAKENRTPGFENRWPLIEKRMSRQDCKQWLARRGLTVPKSACVFCPYQGPKQWAAHQKNPTDWEKIVRIDRELNKRGEFLHPVCKPIDTIDFNPEESAGQLDMFGIECEGMCGV